MFCSAVFSFTAVHLDSASETLLIEIYTVHKLMQSEG